uniref:KIAA1549 n=1 Tax=Leptobrachium leishanense TaxID=445787 RepID=A0A8C5Q0T3_9ANUR
MPFSCHRYCRTEDMDRVVRRASALCTLLILGIGLVLEAETAEVIASFGPLSLLNETSKSTTNTSEPNRPALTSILPDISREMTEQTLNSIQIVESTVPLGLEEHTSVYTVFHDLNLPESTGMVTVLESTNKIIVTQAVEHIKTIDQGELSTLFSASPSSEFTNILRTIFPKLDNSVQITEPTITNEPGNMTSSLLTLFPNILAPPGTISTNPENTTLPLEPTTSAENNSTLPPVFLSSPVLNIFETTTANLQSSMVDLEPTVTTGPFSSPEEFTLTMFNAQPTRFSSDSILYDSLTSTEALDASALSTSYLEASGPSQAESASIFLDVKSSFFMATVSEPSTSIFELEIFNVTEINPIALPISTTYDDVTATISSVLRSVLEMSLQNAKLSTLPLFYNTEEDTSFVIYSTQLTPSVPLHSNADTIDEISMGTTSLTTESPLQSILSSSAGLSTLPNATTMPEFSIIMPLISSPSMVYEVSSSGVSYFSTSQLMTQESVFTTFSVPVPLFTQTQTILPPNVLSSSNMMSTTSLGYFGITVQNAGTSSNEFLDIYTSEVFSTVFPSASMVTLSTRHMDSLASLTYLTNLDSSSVFETPLVTTIPFLSVEMGTRLFSVMDSKVLMPLTTEMLFTSTSSVFVDQTIGGTTVLPVSTPVLDTSYFEPINTVEAPAFVPTESFLYFSKTMFPSEMSLDVSDFVSSHSSRDYILEPSSSMYSLYGNIITSLNIWVSSEILEPLSQGSNTMLQTSAISLISTDFHSEFIPVTESINFEGSGLMPGQTSHINPIASMTSLYNSNLSYESTAVFSQSTVQVKATSVLPLEPEFLDTSTDTDATSPLLPSFYSYVMTIDMTASLSSSFGSYHNTSTLTGDHFQTSLFLSPIPGLFTTTYTPSNAYTFPVNMIQTSSNSMSPTQGVPLTLGLTPASNEPLSVKSTTHLQLPSSSIYLTPTEHGTVVLLPFVSSLPTKSTTMTNTGTAMTTTVSTPTSNISSTSATSSTPRVPISPPSGITGVTSITMTRPTLLCDITNPDPYLVTAVLLQGANVEVILESIKEVLTVQFNRSVELEVYTPFPRLSFIATSGPHVYTSFAVGNSLSTSHLLMGVSSSIISLRTATLGLDQRFHIQTVLQFVPQSVDIRLCTFSEQIQRGLNLALYEVRRWRQESDNITVQIVNITSSASRGLIWKAPVTVSYAVKERNGFLNGSDVSDQLRNLSLVEFSFFLGYPVKQIAELLLGVMDQRLKDESFQAEMERKLAQLISEATGQKRRWKRASTVGVNTVQVVNVSRLDDSDDPVQLIYFIENQYGDRLSAMKASEIINEVDIQRAAIIIGYRLKGVVAQPLNQVPEQDRQAQNLWIIIGVAVPVLVVTVIIVILYWKLCRTDKLDFQPDTMSNLQQRQKLQAPNVKGFDFAKQHLGQHNKEDILVIHEPPPPVLHGPLKDSTPSENGDVPTPKSKGSSKPLRVGRHRGSRITPSDAGSTASEQSSGKESAEEGSPRPSAPPLETKPRLGVKSEIPVLNSGTEQHSSASIFEHVDRISRSSEASRRFPSKIQLIAMQPIAAPPLHGLSVSEREAEANKINREIQTTLRHKSEIEHHRNKIRLRAKRKGHYEFPLVDVVAMTDTKERQRMYRKAQMQFDKILDPVTGAPTVFIEPRKSSRARRSPKQRRRQQGSGSPQGADRDRLITTDSDGTYKRPPGVSNSAYVSDPDIPSDNPTPVSELGKFPGSPHRPPPAQYVAPQPSIEEVRQTMQSLLDDAFALVAPTSHTTGTPVHGQTSGTSGQQPVSSTPVRAVRSPAPWGSPYPPQHASYFNRYVDYNVTQPSAPSLLTRSPGFASDFIPPADVIHPDLEQTDSQYAARAVYPEEVPSVARPRPLGSTAGSAQIHQLTQVGIASRMGAQPSEPNRVAQQPSTGPSWTSYYQDEENICNISHRDSSHYHGPQDYGSSQMFSVNRGPVRQPLPTSHLPPSICYPSGSTENLHPGHSSASLIKAIREELLRLSQKQAAVTTYHS